jgi:hypothetical protein
VITGITSRAAITIGHSNAASMRSLRSSTASGSTRAASFPLAAVPSMASGFAAIWRVKPSRPRRWRRAPRVGALAGREGPRSKVLGFALDRVGARPFAA